MPGISKIIGLFFIKQVHILNHISSDECSCVQNLIL